MAKVLPPTYSLPSLKLNQLVELAGSFKNSTSFVGDRFDHFFARFRSFLRRFDEHQAARELSWNRVGHSGSFDLFYWVSWQSLKFWHVHWFEALRNVKKGVFTVDGIHIISFLK